MRTVDVGTDFYPRIVHRCTLQGDGKHTADRFIHKYLSALCCSTAWKEKGTVVCFDFSNVITMSPGFANTAFGSLMVYADSVPHFLTKVCFINISKVKMEIILEELAACV